MKSVCILCYNEIVIYIKYGIHQLVNGRFITKQLNSHCLPFLQPAILILNNTEDHNTESLHDATPKAVKIEDKINTTSYSSYSLCYVLAF